MEDLFNTTILCSQCNRPTEKLITLIDNFQLRKWVCKFCDKEWPHPEDIEKYNNFKNLKERKFQVKLRKVGNSHTISIPKEIIAFEGVFEKTLNELIDLNLEEPGKLSIYFSRRIKLIKPNQEQQ